MDSMGGDCGLERGTECVVGWEEGKGGRGEEGKGGRYCMPGSLNNTAAQHRKEHYDAL